MEWTTEQVRDEITRRVHEARDQMQREMRVKQVVLRLDDHDRVLRIRHVLPTSDGLIVEVD